MILSKGIARQLDAADRFGEENLLLNSYLFEMRERIGEKVPAEEAESFLEEVHVHLAQAIRIRTEKGQSRLQATRSALDKFGPAGANADDFLASWFESDLRTPLSRRFGRANLAAYGAFQMAEVLCLLIFQLNVFAPNEAGYHIPFSPAQVRSVWPEPLPFPDFSPHFFVTIGTPTVLPIVAGGGGLLPRDDPADSLLLRPRRTDAARDGNVAVRPVSDRVLAPRWLPHSPRLVQLLSRLPPPRALPIQGP